MCSFKRKAKSIEILWILSFKTTKTNNLFVNNPKVKLDKESK